MSRIFLSIFDQLTVHRYILPCPHTSQSSSVCSRDCAVVGHCRTVCALLEGNSWWIPAGVHWSWTSCKDPPSGSHWSHSSPPWSSASPSPGWHSRPAGGSSDRGDPSTWPEDETQSGTGHLRQHRPFLHFSVIILPINLCKRRQNWRSSKVCPCHIWAFQSFLWLATGREVSAPVTFTIGLCCEAGPEVHELTSPLTFSFQRKLLTRVFDFQISLTAAGNRTNMRIHLKNKLPWWNILYTQTI